MKRTRLRGHARSPRRLDINAMARTLDRFEFVMAFVAWRTRDKQGRELSGGLQVKQIGKKWRVGYPNIGEHGAWQDYSDARMAFEHIRRTAASFYTNEAEELRAAF